MNKPDSFPLQREIWLIKHQQTSSENRKIFRPYLIVSNNLQNQYDQEVIGLPLTTQKITNKLIAIPLDKSSFFDIGKESWILVNRIYSMNKELRLVKKVGLIDETTWKVVLNSLWRTFKD